MRSIKGSSRATHGPAVDLNASNLTILNYNQGYLATTDPRVAEKIVTTAGAIAVWGSLFLVIGYGASRLSAGRWG
jgi:hypothetical protein